MTETMSYTDSKGNELTIEPNTDWVNMGDANPKGHGGMFIRFENGMWRIIETRHGHDLPDGYCSDEEIAIWTNYAEPMDLFEGGDPNNGPTNYLRNEINALSRIDSYEQALFNNDIEYFLHGFAHHTHCSNEQIVSENDYWNTLSDMGVSIDKFK